MTEKKGKKIKLTKEQLNSLSAAFLPVIREFYESERGKKMWEEHLREKAKGTTEKEDAA